MDYLDQVAIQRQVSWTAFNGWRRENGLKLALFSTKAATSYLDHTYTTGEILLFGRESAGVPDDVHQAADTRLLIPMKTGLRSINLAVSCAMAMGEALRQTNGFPTG